MPLGVLPAYLSGFPGPVLAGSEALAVSADGSVIVGDSHPFNIDGSQKPGPGLLGTAFIWTAASGMLDLRAMLIADGVTGLQGWILNGATGISADGRTIAGTGTDPSGATEAWVVTLPEPSSLVLAAFGVLVLVACRWRIA